MWKKIKNFPNYEINETGEIKNIKRNKLLKPTSNKAGKGYLYVSLYNNGKHKRFFVHRLVAICFIPNVLNKPYVNHKDGNTINNSVDNLEWVTSYENVRHASLELKVMKGYEIHNEKMKKPVLQIDYYTKEIVNKFGSIREASKSTGIASSNIVDNLKNRQTHTKGFIWCYAYKEE